MKRTPIGHIRKHWVPCKECDGLMQLPEKVQTTKGTETRWSPCWRCKGTGLMLGSVEELTTVFDDPKPPAEAMAPEKKA